MEKLYEILKDCRPDVDFHAEKHLIDDGILESLDIVMIIGELSDNFDVEIAIDEITPDNLNSAEAMFEMITKLQNEG